METIIKDSNAIMIMEEDNNTGDAVATVDSDATVSLPDEMQVLMRIRF